MNGPYIHPMNRAADQVTVILLTQAIGPLDYRLPDGMIAAPGSVVVVPLGPRRMVGVIWDADVFPSDTLMPNGCVR